LTISFAIGRKLLFQPDSLKQGTNKNSVVQLNQPPVVYHETRFVYGFKEYIKLIVCHSNDIALLLQQHDTDVHKRTFVLNLSKAISMFRFGMFHNGPTAINVDMKD
jgi:hypothetical protein